MQLVTFSVHISDLDFHLLLKGMGLHGDHFFNFILAHALFGHIFFVFLFLLIGIALAILFPQELILQIHSVV